MRIENLISQFRSGTRHPPNSKFHSNFVYFHMKFCYGRTTSEWTKTNRDVSISVRSHSLTQSFIWLDFAQATIVSMPLTNERNERTSEHAKCQVSISLTLQWNLSLVHASTKQIDLSISQPRQEKQFKFDGKMVFKLMFELYGGSDGGSDWGGGGGIRMKSTYLNRRPIDSMKF